jgi:zona occludens toxin (predicted ATPase)
MRLKRPAYLKTYMTLGGETDSSNPSRLIFSIKIPVSPRKETTFNIYSNLRTTERRDARSKKLLWTKKKVLSLFNL